MQAYRTREFHGTGTLTGIFIGMRRFGLSSDGKPEQACFNQRAMRRANRHDRPPPDAATPPAPAVPGFVDPAPHWDLHNDVFGQAPEPNDILEMWDLLDPEGGI
jgi:hypothetical protein